MSIFPSREQHESWKDQLALAQEEIRDMERRSRAGEFVDFPESTELHLGLRLSLGNMRNLDRRLRALEENEGG